MRIAYQIQSIRSDNIGLMLSVFIQFLFIQKSRHIRQILNTVIRQ